MSRIGKKGSTICFISKEGEIITMDYADYMRVLTCNSKNGLGFFLIDPNSKVRKLAQLIYERRLTCEC